MHYRPAPAAGLRESCTVGRSLSPHVGRLAQLAPCISLLQPALLGEAALFFQCRLWLAGLPTQFISIPINPQCHGVLPFSRRAFRMECIHSRLILLSLSLYVEVWLLYPLKYRVRYVTWAPDPVLCSSQVPFNIYCI